jgi:hypothetical protein
MTKRLERENMPAKPQPFPVRERGGKWEVLLSSPDMWFQVDSEADARTIARSIVLRHGILDEGQEGDSVASKCDRAAKVLAAYHLNVAARWFARRGSGK